MLSCLPVVVKNPSDTADSALASSISDKWAFPIIDEDNIPDEGFYLQIERNVLGLADAGDKKVLPIEVDFASPASLQRHLCHQRRVNRGSRGVSGGREHEL